MLTSTEKSAIKIRDLILYGTFKPGEMLSQRKIAGKLGVSPIVVRESLRSLEKEGLVENIPKWGTRVVPFDINRLKGQFLVREALEGMIARLVSEKISEEELSRLYALADEVDQLFQDANAETRKVSTTHYRFHRSIAALCGCKELLTALDYINVQQLIWFTSEVVDLKNVVPEPFWHRKLIDALASHNPDEAEKSARLHARKGLESILASLPEAEMGNEQFE